MASKGPAPKGTGVLFRSFDSYIDGATDGEESLPAIALRQEVAFERWFHSYQVSRRNDQATECTQRTWAVIACLEGALKTVIEAVAFVVTWLAERCWPTVHSSEKHLKVLKAQARGTYLSALAVYSPDAAIKEVLDSDEKSKGGHPFIGCASINWEWGTPYTGTLTRWSFECCCDHWVERKN